jgi:hypothetical protein
MSSDDAPQAKVVDLRRWREERDRRLRAQARVEEPVELVSARAPDRIAWPFRLLAVFTGLGFAVLGGLLGSLPVIIPASDPPLPWPTRVLLLLFALPVGIAMALFGIDLVGRGFVGRDWMSDLWHHALGWLDRRARWGGRGSRRPSSPRPSSPGEGGSEGSGEEGSYSGL